MKSGRPNLRWKDSIEKYLRILGIRGWKTKVLDRSLWRRLMEEANAHTVVAAVKNNSYIYCHV
jgi:hypothetical protein